MNESGASRRQFLSHLGSGALLSTLGAGIVGGLGLARTSWLEDDTPLDLGRFRPWIDRMQQTAPDRLLEVLAQALREGAPARDLVAAAALANAEALGGTDYDGYHSFMALMPAWGMAGRLPPERSPLPILKVIHRSTGCIRSAGDAGRMAQVPATAGDVARLRSLERAGALEEAERTFQGFTQGPSEQAFEALQTVVRDTLDVHQIVLSWRSWDVMRLTSAEFAAPLLRQSLRHCVDRERMRQARGRPEPEIRRVLPALMERHALERAPQAPARPVPADRFSDLVDLVYGASRADAAEAIAESLRDGFDPEELGEVLSVAAMRLLLADPGRTRGEAGKPVGSVHGASVGVHAADSANAWRQLARMGSWRHRAASLVAGAFHTAGQSQGQRESGLPSEATRAPLSTLEGPALLRRLDGAIREGDQGGACAAAQCALQRGVPAEDVQGILLEHSLVADGALHAEKFFFTAVEEYATTRPGRRDAALVACARVCASQAAFRSEGFDRALAALSG